MGINIAETVKLLVSVGMETKEATDAVKKVLAKFEEMGKEIDMDEKAFAHLIMIGNEKNTRAGAADVFYAVPLGYSGEFDDNGNLKKEIMEVYSKNPQMAISEGMVKVEVGADGKTSVIPYDYRETFGKNGEYENRNFGKVIETKMMRNIYAVIDGEMKTMKYTKPLHLGLEYEIKGKCGVGKYANAYHATPIGDYSQEEAFDRIVEIGESVDFAYSINDLPDVEDKTLVLVRGYVHDVFPTKFGMGIKIRDDESVDTLVGFSQHAEVEADMNSIAIGSDIILFGRIQQRDAEPVIKVMGFFVNPLSHDYKDVVDDVSAILNS